MMIVVATRHTDGIAKRHKKIGEYLGSDNNYYDILEVAPNFISYMLNNNVARKSKLWNRRNNYEVTS